MTLSRRRDAAVDDTHPCVDCGDPYFQRIGGYWKVDDGLWDEVVGDNTITLCPACFAARANSRDIYLRWMAYRDTDGGSTAAVSSAGSRL